MPRTGYKGESSKVCASQRHLWSLGLLHDLVDWWASGERHCRVPAKEAARFSSSQALALRWPVLVYSTKIMVEG
jgi:hypothetical protein